jgi:hypothetical protein
VDLAKLRSRLVGRKSETSSFISAAERSPSPGGGALCHAPEYLIVIDQCRCTATVGLLAYSIVRASHQERKKAAGFFRRKKKVRP